MYGLWCVYGMIKFLKLKITFEEEIYKNGI